MKKIILAALFIPIHTICDLIDLSFFIKSLPELVVSDTNEWNNPDYATFYRTRISSLSDKLLHFLKLRAPQPWNINTIKTLLDTIVLERKKYSALTPYVVNITGKEGSKYIVWGDLFGAAHSLFRTLEYLYEQKILDSHFRIAPGYTFIFLGNVIDRYAYSLETLFIVLVLMAYNPNQVFYLKGSHERDDLWKDFSLNTQINIQLQMSDKQKEAFKKSLSDFFDTLPEALYINQKDQTKEVIRLSNESRSSYDFDESHIGNLFSKEPDTIDYLQITKNKVVQETQEVVSILRGGNYTQDKIAATNGLRFIEPDLGTTAWSLISSQTPVYQQFFNFYFDAFAEITLGKTIEDATIQLLYQDVRNRVGFFKDTLFRIVSGQTVYSPTAFDKHPYYIGSTMPLTKSLGYMGQSVQRCMSAVVNQYNQEGGIKGHSIRPIILDDQYEPSIARRNIELLKSKRDIDTVLLPVGSPSLSGYIDLVEKHQISVIFPVTGSPAFRKKDLTSIIHWRTSYAQEVRTLIKYMISQHETKKFAFFYQDDAYGQGALTAAREILKELGISQWTEVPYNRTSTDFSRQIDLIKKGQPDAVGLFSTGLATEALMRALSLDMLISTKFFGISFVGDNVFRKFIKNLGVNIIFSQVVPNPTNSTLPIVQAFRNLMDLGNNPYDIFSLESYIGTNLYLEALKVIKGPVTGEKIIEHFQTFKDVKYKGIHMNFNPNTRTLSNRVWIEINENEWLEQEVE